jgi:hypothetical protein
MVKKPVHCRLDLYAFRTSIHGIQDTYFTSGHRLHTLRSQIVVSMQGAVAYFTSECLFRVSSSVNAFLFCPPLSTNIHSLPAVTQMDF